MKTKKVAAKKAAVKNSEIKKSIPNKASTKNVPKRATVPEKKAFKKASTTKIIAKENISTQQISDTPINRLSNHIISRSTGAGLIDRFNANRLDLNSLIFNYAVEFDKSLFENLLALEGATKIRIYNAANEKNEHTYVITAVDKSGKDIYTKIPAQLNRGAALARSAETAPDYGVGNMGQQCTDPTLYKP
jgi:hypothetical protein